MGFNEDQDNSFSRDVSGAIFMSNRSTKKECLKRKLFGLPYAQANFVKSVKAGMILFLYEFEEKKLHGVFRASSDGAMNIVPHAYQSSSKQFPAQVRFEKLWNCYPLSEYDFRDAIKENYYSESKFRFDLSADQVYELLQLFGLRKVKSQKSQSGSSGRVIQQSGNFELDGVRSLVGDKSDIPKRKFSMHNEHEKLDKNCGESTRVSQTQLNNLDIFAYRPDTSRVGDFSRLSSMAPDSLELRSLTRYHDVARHTFNVSDISDKLLTRKNLSPLSLGPQRPTFLGSPSQAEHAFSLRDSPNVYLPTSGYAHSSVVGMDQNPVEEKHHVAAYSKNISDAPFPSPRNQQLMMTSHIDPKDLNMSSTGQPSLDCSANLEDYIPLPSADDFEPLSTSILFPDTSSYFGNHGIVVESYLGKPVPNLCARNEDYGRLNRSSLGPIQDHPPYVLEESFPATSQYTPNFGAACYSDYVPSISPKSLSALAKPLIQVGDGYRSDSPCMDLYEERAQDRQSNHENDDEFGTQRTMHSDAQIKRKSVFSRLTAPAQNATARNSKDDDRTENNLDLSINQIMDSLRKKQTSWRRTKDDLESSCRRAKDEPEKYLVHLDEESFAAKRQRNMTEDVALENEVDSHSEGAIVDDTRLYNFKRRSRSQKDMNKTAEEAHSEGPPGAPLKRRKLVRPSIGITEMPLEVKNVGNETLVCSNVVETNESTSSKTLDVENTDIPKCSKGTKVELERTLTIKDPKVDVEVQKGVHEERIGVTNCSLKDHCSPRDNLNGFECDNVKLEETSRKKIEAQLEILKNSMERSKDPLEEGL
ncbi:hypothetical protein GIB67_043231 [Kingdonia uniflora]|uniref:DCD domain-containing protein n=1 Tax=Kingdonia uniflora TaxID=39325 RepID=A0A7J7L2Q4_9MAGN|nr:hypothetical protein GIB67_043231 [Kingdonia uniflora]